VDILPIAYGYVLPIILCQAVPFRRPKWRNATFPESRAERKQGGLGQIERLRAGMRPVI
jgi:hypothetical protein